MGMGNFQSMTPPPINPINFQGGPSPGGRRPRSYLRRGKWSTDSVDQELPFIEQTKRIIENPGSTIEAGAGSSFRSKLKFGLEQLGWKYNRRATFKANFPFGSTYLIFDSTAELDAEERYMIKMVMGSSSVLDYKIMKWVFVKTPARGFELNFIDLLTNRIFLVIVALTVVALLIIIFISSFNLCGQPVEQSVVKGGVPW